jgi:DNA-binding IclR family transcriptional regulator
MDARSEQRTWTFFSNHAHALFCLARDPDARIRDIARLVGITERAAQRIVTDLVTEGYLAVERRGRRNHYAIRPNRTLRHPVEAGVPIASLLDLLLRHSPTVAAAPATLVPVSTEDVP